jgi:hypothetical protein
MIKKKKRKTAATAQATITGKSGLFFMLSPVLFWPADQSTSQGHAEDQRLCACAPVVSQRAPQKTIHAAQYSPHSCGF